MLTIQYFTFNPFQENTYIIYNEDKACWIVDAGMFDNAEIQTLCSFIENNNLKPQAIINTHAHIDHILGARAVMDRYAVPFYLHAKEEPILNNSKGAAAMFGFDFSHPPTVSGWLEEGQIIEMGAGNAVKVLLTPGHSPGSVSFYNEKDKWVIAGDALFNGSIGRTDLPGGNHDELLHSIRTQLFTLPGNTKVYPGHGPATTIANETAYNPFFQ